MSPSRRALITGITGQDGSYLAELLLSKGYEVHGLVRRGSSIQRERIDRIRERLTLHYGDMIDSSSLHTVLKLSQPDEIYNLAAQSHVPVSFEMPEYTCDVTATGVGRLLEAMRAAGSQAHFYQASSSEMFGKVRESPQNESTPFHPRSPYAAAKVYAYHLTVNYREAHGIFACNGMLFNHESPRRGENFVTRKITRAVGRIRAGTQKTLELGNLDARRDWGFAADYVLAMWQMLQQPEPDDYVVSTGETHSVKEFLELAFAHAGLDWRDHVETGERHLRATEVDGLLGDASKARRVLGWAPIMSFEKLIETMVDSDIELARREAKGG